MASATVKAVKLEGTVETYESNFITAVPAGATDTITVDLPKGWYVLRIYGTQAAAGTSPTLLVKSFVDAVQTSGNAVALAMEKTSVSAPILTAVTLTLTLTGLSLYLLQALQPGAVGSTGHGDAPIYIPHGLEITYTKAGGTATSLTLAAQRVG